MAVVPGGQPIYGAALGILMLEARFARVPGDMGNAGTWPFPVLYHVVRGASPARVVLGGAEGLLQPFLDGAAALVSLGAAAINHQLRASCRCFSGSWRRMSACRSPPVR
ncbi:MAG: hypothetical protein WDN49_25415 [Acetobacteraceae bacterium]